MSDSKLPLAGLKVVELTHMVMGPSTGLILADMGADVVRIEPPGGDRTRRLLGSGAGYFPMYNRNKQSICLDLKKPAGLAAAKRLAVAADIVVENFRPGTLEKMGLGYAALSAENPRLIYCSAKGFLSGPYEERAALDEVAQMMGGLAYMTGPPGRPLRAGASVIDVTGGMFGVVGVLGLLERRHRTGLGGEVKASLYETTTFLVGQHMAQMAVTGKPAAPMPARISAWAIYDVFNAADGQLFVGVVSDAQWRAFCAGFGLEALGADAALAENNQRVQARERILPEVRALFAGMTLAEALAKCEVVGLPFAPIARPEQLFDDPHLNAAGGLVDMTLPGGGAARLPALPIEVDGERMGLRHDLKAPGQDTAEILAAAGFVPHEVEAMLASGAAA
ncbi:CaiB/BaiF CoA transferase family protein [Sandaracinobacteroides hominis]|uniref:CaiB/BaiF CoA transferase family protein n=1 Tax=Sandaracinobacteroides hominis TaxID=2780086 RepID=UPI0018F6DADC|nr:CoA transferase [Sandaracinobacteroides hominis]